jgi:serine/threonine protein kinase
MAPENFSGKLFSLNILNNYIYFHLIIFFEKYKHNIKLCRPTAQSDMYSAGCVMYKLMMSKVPFDTSNPFSAAAVVGKGDYEKIPKKSKGGLYSDEFVDIIYSMMELVFFNLYDLHVLYFPESRKKTNK